MFQGQGERGLSEALVRNIAQRPACPFYGFTLIPGGFLEQKGNQCPFAEGYTPCVMEIQGQPPTWTTCTQYRTASNVEQLKEALDNPCIALQGRAPITLREWLGLTTTQL